VGLAVSDQVVERQNTGASFEDVIGNAFDTIGGEFLETKLIFGNFNAFLVNGDFIPINAFLTLSSRGINVTEFNGDNWQTSIGSIK